MWLIGWIFTEALMLGWRLAKLAFAAAIVLGLLRSLTVPEVPLLLISV